MFLQNTSYAVNGNKKSIRYQSIRVSERRQTIDFNDFGLDLPSQQNQNQQQSKDNNKNEDNLNNYTEINNDIYIINALKIINEKKNVKKGIEYLNREGMIDKNEKEIVKFLRLYQKEIDDEALGEYLGEPGDNEEESKFYTKIREMYLDYNYASKTFEEGLRFMLTQGGFKYIYTSYILIFLYLVYFSVFSSICCLNILFYLLYVQITR